MKLTIVYDNERWSEGLISDWGFSCLIQTDPVNILFDTGANGLLLLRNMNKLGVNPEIIDVVFISHGHWDHMGGLSSFLEVKQVPVILPASVRAPGRAEEVTKIKESVELYPGIYTTGELKGIEQSLVIRIGGELLVVVGCAHPGVANILKAASQYGEVAHLVGGLHGFDDFSLLEGLKTVCPVHCTQHKLDIKLFWPDKWVQGGVGRVLEFPEPVG